MISETDLSETPQLNVQSLRMCDHKKEKRIKVNPADFIIFKLKDALPGLVGNKIMNNAMINRRDLNKPGKCKATETDVRVRRSEKNVGIEMLVLL